MTYAFWKDHEDAYLRKEWASSELTVDQIADHLKRTTRGCSERALTLDLGPKVRAGRSDWTHERVELLKKRWAEDLSPRAIAAELGVSKNTVVGKAHRLKLPMRSVETVRLNTALNRPQHMGRKVSPKPKQAPQSAKPRLAIHGNGAVIEVAVAPPPFAGLKRRAFEPIPDTSPRPWMDRGADECCWPVGGGLSCCAPVHKRGWCSTHYQLGTVARQERTPAQAAADEVRRFSAIRRRAA